MKRLFLMLALLVPLSVHADKPEPLKTFNAQGSKIKYGSKWFAPEVVVIDDEARMNQDSALNVAHLLYRRLAEGNLDRAAALSNAPEKLKELYGGFKEKMGEADFQKAFSGYFKGDNAYLGEVRIGKHVMLLLRVKELDNEAVAQFYVLQDGKYWVDDLDSKEKAQLGELFNAYKAKQLKLN